MQRVEAKLRDKDPSVNVVTRSGMATRGPGEKTATETLIRPVVSKHEGLDLKKQKETSITAHKYLSEAEASGLPPPEDLKADEEVKPFLHGCMKLFHNPRVVENLQALIESCEKKLIHLWKLRMCTKCTGIRDTLVGKCG